VSESICEECRKMDDPVTPENGVSVPDAQGRIVLIHSRCVNAWILKQSKNPPD